MKIVAVIPARMGSTRFPGKPLAMICGRPMIEHVYRRATLSARLSAVYIATPDTEIAEAASAFGSRVILTSARHVRATDRVAEAANNVDADVIVMLQGDEPMIVPAMIDSALQPLIGDDGVGCSNLIHRIRTRDEYEDRNTIKVVSNRSGDAVYFSRSPIPAAESQSGLPPHVYKQVCVIPFRRHVLERFAFLQPTPLEICESIDMLRLIEHDLPIRLVETDVPTHAVDTPSDLQLVNSLMADDPLLHHYE